MRKLWLCLPMMMLLLTGCGQTGVSEAEETALAIRGEYLGMEGCTTQLAITVDYGQRVYQYEMEAKQTKEDISITYLAPETVEGMTAHFVGEDGKLEYDGVWVETGKLDRDGLAPVSAFPAFLEAARSGYMSSCALEEETSLLRVDYRDPEGSPGSGREIVLWFDPSDHTLTKGEISVDGFRVIDCQFTGFTKTT